VRREGLEVSQSALDRRFEIHHAITTRARGPGPPGGVHGRVQDAHCGDGGDAGPPCTESRTAWRCAWRIVQNDLVHGWGLECSTTGSATARDRAANVGVVDSEYVLHASTAACSTPPPRRAHARRQVGGVGRGEVAVFQGDADFQQAVGGGCRGGRVMD